LTLFTKSKLTRSFFKVNVRESPFCTHFFLLTRAVSKKSKSFHTLGFEEMSFLLLKLFSSKKSNNLYFLKSFQELFRFLVFKMSKSEFEFKLVIQHKWEDDNSELRNYSIYYLRWFKSSSAQKRKESAKNRFILCSLLCLRIEKILVG
jgi:hypothetical protein